MPSTTARSSCGKYIITRHSGRHANRRLRLIALVQTRPRARQEFDGTWAPQRPMPGGGRRLPPWTSPRSAGAPSWSPAATPAAGACGPGPSYGTGTPPGSAGCFGTRVTPPTSGIGGARVTPPTSGTGGCSSRPPRPPPSLDSSPYVRAKQAQVTDHRRYRVGSCLFRLV